MRPDNIGMFWEDKLRERGQITRIMPAIPDTGWTAPKELPRLDDAQFIALDTETYDPELKQKGPGWPTKNGHLVGISVAVPEGQAWYLPMRHEVGGGNLDPDVVLRWARDQLGGKQVKVGANIAYDVGWLQAEGVHVKGPLLDVQYAEALLDEYARSYALDRIAKSRGFEGKHSQALYEWCSRAYGGAPKARDQGGNIYRAPVSLVGPYAEMDALLPMQIWRQQRAELVEQELLALLRLECKLIPMLIAMRTRGVRVDVAGAEQLSEKLEAQERAIEERIRKEVGYSISVDSNDELALAFRKLHLPIRSTAAGNPSFAAPVLENTPGTLPKLILAKRRVAKARGTFVDGYVLNKHVNGYVYGEFHPLRSDEGGTVSGRYSSSNPNLQNIPARDPELGPAIRGLFLPEPGEQWVAIDYSQIEYRLLAHYAVGIGADRVRALYRDDPKTDFHVSAQNEIITHTGTDIGRKNAKNINFGLVYGMGEPTLCSNLGLTRAEGSELFAAYHDGVPFVRETFNHASRIANKLGYITTLLGRRARFTLYESTDWELSQIDGPVSLQYAQDQYGRAYRRAMTHKALNRRLQGSAADVLKKAMLGLWEAGHVPMVTVHDENGFSWNGDKAVLAEWTDIMEQAVSLRVPTLVDVEIGPTWGAAK